VYRRQIGARIEWQDSGGTDEVQVGAAKQSDAVGLFNEKMQKIYAEMEETPMPRFAAALRLRLCHPT
jgi:hypothetical protein